MIDRRSFAVGLAAVATLSRVLVVCAVEPRVLFDGKTLAGWKTTDFGGQGDVSVQDGAIVMEFGSEMTGITWKGEPLPKTNYEIELDAARLDGSDFFCGLTFPVKDAFCSLILGGWGGGVTGLSSLNGQDAANNDTTSYRSYKEGKWYHVRLRVTDERVLAKLDDATIVDANITDKKISTRIEVDLSKPLGISCYSTRAGLKNITLRELTLEEVKTHNAGK